MYDIIYNVRGRGFPSVDKIKEGCEMTKRDYVDVLKWAIRSQMESVEESLERDYSEYREGILRGLEVAMEKIDASMFLVEQEG